MGILKKLKIAYYDAIRISDLEWYGGTFIRKELTDLHLFSRRYNGELNLEGKTYYVSVKVSLLGGEIIYALPYKAYQGEKTTAQAKVELQNQVNQLYKKNYESAKKRRRSRILYCLASTLFIIIAILGLLYLLLNGVMNGFDKRDLFALATNCLIILFSLIMYAKVQ